MSGSGFKLGGVNYPIDAGSALSLIEQTDRAVFCCLKFSQAVLNGYLQPLWSQVVTRAAANVGKTASTRLPGNPDGYLVADLVPEIPSPFLDQGTFRFPLLALDAGKATYGYRAIHKPQTIRTFHLDLILPPLELRALEVLQAILPGARAVLASRLPVGCDGYYTDETNWGLSSGVASVTVKQSEIAPWKLTKQGEATGLDLNYLILNLEIEVTQEESLNTTNLVPFSGLSDGYVMA